MNNKPVAWMNKIDSNLVIKAPCEERKFNWIPLYTHPVNPYQSITNTKIEPTVVSYTHPVKELTDEEITICMGSLPKYNSEIVDEDLVNFARAILRKAQE